MLYSPYHLRRLSLSYLGELSLRLFIWQQEGQAKLRTLFGLSTEKPEVKQTSQNPTRPEDFDPTSTGNIEQPYEYYRLLRDQRPVYKPDGLDFYCISRYEDIQEVAKKTDVFSSNIVGVLLDKRKGGVAGIHSVGKPGQASQRNMGAHPVDVLAIQDPPAHKYQKLLTHKIVSTSFVQNLEPDVRVLADELISEFMPEGRVEFMTQVAWRLPMLMAMRLVGFPEPDYEQVKRGCSHAVQLLAGVLTPAEFARHSVEALVFFRYCWNQYLIAKKNPKDDITGGLAKAASDPEHPLTDEEAVSIIFQLLIAGSDSSASTMGNAVRLLSENPELEQRLRKNPGRIADFIEEVFRLESAFQGHFRILLEDAELHGEILPKGSRLFLLWASGNRDERYWSHPDEIDIDRTNLKRHLTFGFGLHACLGRELARMEIRVVLEELLARTSAFNIVGDTPHVASLFTRTLVQLPMKFEINSSNLKVA